jgi:hypothetical protein
MADWFSDGLASAPLLGVGRSRSINAENPDGRKGGAGRESSALGPGRKGRAYIGLAAGETATLADIEGPGVIRHIWMTVIDRTERHGHVLRDLVLRMRWDDEPAPSVEVPLGDFFLNGFAAKADVVSLPIVVAPHGGMNCYLPMPFAQRARVTISSEHPADIEAFFFQIDYQLVDALPAATGTLHVQWRREPMTTLGRDYTVLDGVQGRGKYIGTYLAISALEGQWYGEGEMKFYIDGDDELPTICGTGTEDYVGGAWGFQREMGGADPQPVTYSTPYFGYPYHATGLPPGHSPYARATVPRHGMYRWHLLDPIEFDSDLRVTLQQIGHDGHRLFERSDDVSSVAYWYQEEPHGAFPELPAAERRRPR